MDERGRRRRRPGRAAVLLVGLVVVLAGAACGTGADQSSGPSGATVTGSGTPDASPSASGEPSSAPPRSAPPTTARPAPAPAPSAATATPPAPPPPSAPTTQACPGRDLERLPTQEHEVALTIDLGGDDAGLGPILTTLADRDVRATFFVTGEWARRHPDGLRRVVAEGHVLGNHTDTHPHLTELSNAEVRAQISSAETEVVRITGHNPRPLFRFPFGDRDERTLGVVESQGYCAYRWTVDTLGWQGTGAGITATAVRDRVLAALQPGQIVLMHAGANPDDGSTLDADALPGLIDELRARGYGFTTLPRGGTG